MLCAHPEPPAALVCRRALLHVLAATALGVWAAPAQALPLVGTIWDAIGGEVGCDPHLLYAVALIESAAGARPGWVRPHPLAVRSPRRAYYPSNLAEAERLLAELKTAHALTDCAVGMMQIYVRWQGHRVPVVEDLLDPWKNVRLGATVLVESMASAPSDRALGIGRYHTWRQEAVARQYGASVLALWRQLKSL